MKKKRTRICLDCGAPITRQATYCKPCGYRNMRHRPPGYKLNIKVKNKGWFIKGREPWNKGIKTRIVTSGCIKKGERISPETEFKKGAAPWNKGEEHTQILGNKHFSWKGDSVGYLALHSWVQRKLGKAKICSKCGATKNIVWSNISGEYLRDTKDFQALCQKCHLRYDRENIPGSMIKNFKEGKRKENL